MRKQSQYRSGLEAKVAQLLPRTFKYEPFSIDYTTHRKYKPDFVKTNKDIEYLIEVKGFFRSQDTMKYKAIRDSLKTNQELIFLLSDSNKKVRKGSKMTMSQWCDKEGIKWFTKDSIDKLEQYCKGA